MDFYLVRQESRCVYTFPQRPEEGMSSGDDDDLFGMAPAPVDDDVVNRYPWSRNYVWELRGQDGNNDNDNQEPNQQDDGDDNPRRNDERDRDQHDNVDANIEENEEPHQDNPRMNGGGDGEEDNERVDEIRGGSARAITIANLEVDLKPVEGTEHNGQFVETVKRAVGPENLIQDLNFKVQVDREDGDEMGSILVKNHSYAGNWYYQRSRCLRDQGKISILKRLISVFGEKNVKFELTICLARLPSYDAEDPDEESLIVLSAKDFKFVKPSDKSVRMSADILKLPSGIWGLWEEGQRLGEDDCFYSRVSMKVRLNETAGIIVRWMNAGADGNERRFMDGNRRLLEEEICSDLEIVCGGGRVVKCHRAFLVGRSAVFRVMFEKRSGGGGEMKEARDGRLELDEKWTEKCVRAMLRWVYSDQVGEGVKKDFELVLELLEAGHKWEVDGLAEEMTAVLMGRREEDEGWWTVGRVIKLFKFARNVEEMKGLRDRAVGIIKRYGMGSGKKLLESEEYQAFFQNDPQTAMVLTTLCIQMS